MKRVHFPELEDQDWIPASIRDAGTDILRFITEVGGIYQPIVPRLKSALAKSGSTEILDLCSGGAGPVLGIYRKLSEAGGPIRVTLTDKYPNRMAFEYAQKVSHEGITFIDEPVDATRVPSHLSGFRTLFTSFRHFQPEIASRILQDAVDSRRPIGIFGFSAFPSPPPLLVPLLGNPLAILLATPFVRPFRWSRLLWTYMIPIVPFSVGWDAFASGFRLYSIRELQGLVNGLDSDGFVWEIGQEPDQKSITYLIGYPEEQTSKSS